MSIQIHDTTIAKHKFEMSGTSVAEWARVRGFSAGLVYQVLEGRQKCMRGQSHQIAVALGIKQGVTISIDELSKQLITHGSASPQER